MSYCSDSDDFVEVNGYQSSDSEWEKIDFNDEEDGEPTIAHTVPHQIVQSYYNHSESPSTHDNLHGQAVPTTTRDEIEKPRSVNKNGSTQQSRNLKEARKKQWTKVLLKQGQGAPYDPVEFLGITGSERALLSHFGISTIGQLAYFNATEFDSSIEADKFAVILDLQERAYEAVTDYVTRSSSQPEIVWGYLYLGDTALNNILKKGYMDSDSLYFLWTPMPTILYRDQITIDNIIGKENKNKELRNRYSRFVKINLSKLCNKYYGRLYQKDPNNMTRQQKWMPTTLLEAAELAQRDDLWCNFEPGNDIYSSVAHGSIVIPTGRISKDCLELDKSTCSFSSPFSQRKRRGERKGEHNESEEEEEEQEEEESSVNTALNYYKKEKFYPCGAWNIN